MKMSNFKPHYILSLSTGLCAPVYSVCATIHELEYEQGSLEGGEVGVGVDKPIIGKFRIFSHDIRLTN